MPAMTRKIRLLCLHSFRTSTHIMGFQLKLGLNASGLLDKYCELVFLDGLEATGPGFMDITKAFGDKPVFEWWNASDDGKVYHNMDKSVAKVEDAFALHGPFDGILGFSQGANFTAALAGLQQNGLALTKYPPLRFVICISGFLARADSLHAAFSKKITVPSVHIIGESDAVVSPAASERLAEAFQPPTLVLRHPKGHTIAKLPGGVEAQLEAFLKGVADGSGAAKY